jgi:hypothetical protein
VVSHLERGDADRAGDPDQAHHGDDRVALPVVLDQPAERARKAERDEQEEEVLEPVAERVGVLERVRGVGVVEAAAVGPQLLDRLLAGNRTAGDGLMSAGQGRDRVRGVQVLHDAGADQHDGAEDRQRQQDAHVGAHQVDPEVADPLGSRPGEPADKGDGDGHTDGGGGEVLHGQSGHLHEVAHRRLTGVRLPVGVRDEGRSRVPRCVGADVREAQREWQVRLQPLERVQEQHRDGGEGEDPAKIDPPGLIGVRVDAHQPVARPFDGKVLLALEHPGHVVAHGAVADREGGYEQQRLQQSSCTVAHQNRSGNSRATTR